MIKKTKSYIFIFMSIISLVACVAPPLEFYPESVPVVGNRIPATLSHVSMRFATSDKRLGDISMATEIQTDYQIAFESALEASLLRSLAFNSSFNRNVLLEAEILKIGGARRWATAEMIVNYKITDLQNGRIIFNQNITSYGRIEANTALRTDIRGIAPTFVNDVSRNNILNFIKALDNR